MNAAFESILENLREIEIVLEKTPSAFRKDRIQTGNNREYTIQEFVSRYFPKSYTIKKGPIYSMKAVSAEIDCVILSPNHPLLITPLREVIIAEGVHAAIEIKPDISTLSSNNKSQIKKGLNQIQSVKKLERLITRYITDVTGPMPLNDYYKKIPTYLFAFKSKSIPEIIKYLLTQVKSGSYELDDLPDFIITLDNGILFYTPLSRESMFDGLLYSHFSQYPSRLFIHFPLDRTETLALFLITLYSVYPPEDPTPDFILKNYFAQFPKGLDFQVFGFSNEEDLPLIKLTPK